MHKGESVLEVRTKKEKLPEEEGNQMNGKNGLKVKSEVKAAGLGGGNHNRTLTGGLKVKANTKAAGLGGGNHNRTLTGGLKVKANTKAAGLGGGNHNRTLASI
jgi:hypothetical protein